MIEAEGRHFRDDEFAAGERPIVPANHLVVAIDQDRDIKAECLDAVGHLPDLHVAVEPRVRGIGLDRAVNRSGGERYALAFFYTD